jgi:hypothetical protein
MYQLTANGNIRRLADGAEIPQDPDNRDYAEFLASGEEAAPWVAPTVVPSSVSAFQARAALAVAGLLDTVEAMMADPATPLVSRLAWQHATEFLRTSPTVAGMGAALGLDEAALDTLFIQASTIQA